MVCHDVVFPESARTLVLKGSELLLNPSLITAQGIGPWRSYLIARASGKQSSHYCPKSVSGSASAGKKRAARACIQETSGDHAR